jgi:hypothetical protein
VPVIQNTVHRLVSEIGPCNRRKYRRLYKAQLEAERAASAELRRIVAGLVQRIPELEAPSEGTGNASEATGAEDRGRASPSSRKAHSVAPGYTASSLGRRAKGLSAPRR